MRWRTLIASLVAWAAVVLAGCASPTLELTIDASDRAEIVELSVEVAASRSPAPEWRVCEPTLALIDPAVDPGWPVVVRVARGADYDEGLAYRARGFDDGGNEIVRVTGHALWTEQGVRHVDVVLPDCGESTCPTGQQLTTGCACELEPIPPLFDDGGYWDQGISCAAGL